MNTITTKHLEVTMSNNKQSIIIPNLVIDLGDAKLTFEKSEININELLDVYMKLEEFIKTNFEHIYL